ncbi:MAG: sigma 54-interacting transcriptional regulator [Pseudomonadota bacterium]
MGGHNLQDSGKSVTDGKYVWETLSSKEKDILFLFAYLTPPVSIDTLIAISEYSPVEILNFMESLKEKKLFFEKKEVGRGFYFPNDANLARFHQVNLDGTQQMAIIRKMIDYYRLLPDQGQESTLALADLYMKSESDAQGLPFIKKAADILYDSGMREKAIRYYDYLIQYFSKTLPNKEASLLYIDSVFKRISMHTFYTTMPLELNLKHAERAHGVAKRHEHHPHLAKLSSMLGVLWHSAGNKHNSSLYIQNFWELAEKIDEESITRFGVRQMSAIMVLNGTLSEATAYYERMIGGLEKFGSTEQDLAAILMVASSHVYCGRISRGLGMIEAVRTVSESLNILEGVCLADMAMAIALIDIRKPDEAELYLNRIKTAAFSNDILDRILMGIYPKCKAYIHLARGNYAEAFENLKLAYMQSASADSPPSYHTSPSHWPWVIECLYTLESKGFYDEDMNFESEVKKLCSSENPYMKGAALRYRALKKMRKQLSEKTILEDLKSSEKYLMQAGAIIELARTKLALGDYYRMQNQPERAQSYQKKARLLLSGIDENLFPKDLLEKMPWEQKIGIIIDRITVINLSLGTARDVPAVLEKAINAAMDFTTAMRGAFFTSKGGDLEITAGRNIVTSLLDSDTITPVKKIIADAAKKDKELIIPSGEAIDEHFRRTGITSLIGMPVKLGEHSFGYLVLDSQLHETLFSEYSIHFARMLASQMALLIFSITNYKEAIDLKNRFQDETIFYRRERGGDTPLNMIIGESKKILKVINQINQVAPSDSSVLILGETGVGKELVAKGIHHMSKRREGPFIAVNIAAMPPDLVASELFGHEKGAFTGANERKKGRFELADGGTIFLDEIGDLPLNIQVKLLRVLQEGTFERLGSSKPIRSDFRVIAATHRDLQSEVQKGMFRQDLYYRLKVFPIEVPPLRERAEDIPLLTRHFLDIFEKKAGKKFNSVPTNELQKLRLYNWPGNVRELEHVIERAVILSSGRGIRFSDLESTVVEPIADDNQPILHLADMERNHIKRALEACRWRVDGPKGAAKILGLKRSTLRYRMKKLGITAISG